ncbi:MAG: hypothetical protein V2G42_07120 [bacterium JZ-2024 1]
MIHVEPVWSLYRPLDPEKQRWGENWQPGIATLPAGTVTGDGDLLLVDRTYAPADGRPRDYRVRIVTPGNLSTARFVFSDDGGASESSPSPLFPPPIPLSHHITVAFTGSRFLMGDTWTFRGLLPAGPDKSGDAARATRAVSRPPALPILRIAYDSGVRPRAVFLSDWLNLSAFRIVAGTRDTPWVSLPRSCGPRYAMSLTPFQLPDEPEFAIHFQPADATAPVEIAEVHLLDFVSDLPALSVPLDGDLVGSDGQRPETPSLPVGWVWRLSFSGMPDADWKKCVQNAEQWAQDSATGRAFILCRTLSEQHPATEIAFIGTFLPPEKARPADHRAHPNSGAFNLRFMERQGGYP